MDNDQDVQLGEIYTDGVTSFAGIATAKTTYLDEPSLIHLENDSDSRWLPVSRCSEASDEVKTRVQEGSFAGSGGRSGSGSSGRSSS